jgi:hypothetical protein
MHAVINLGRQGLLVDFPSSNDVSINNNAHQSASRTDIHSHQMPKTRAALYFMAAYIFIGYLVIQVCYYAILCTPFRQYYALPVVNSECATYTNYSKIQMVFNISSDLFIIILPVSILWRSKLPMKRKFVLMGLFSLGLFTILSAILNKYVFHLVP